MNMGQVTYCREEERPHALGCLKQILHVLCFSIVQYAWNLIVLLEHVVRTTRIWTKLGYFTSGCRELTMNPIVKLNLMRGHKGSSKVRWPVSEKGWRPCALGMGGEIRVVRMRPIPGREETSQTYCFRSCYRSKTSKSNARASNCKEWWRLARGLPWRTIRTCSRN